MVEGRLSTFATTNTSATVAEIISRARSGVNLPFLPRFAAFCQPSQISFACFLLPVPLDLKRLFPSYR
jgi:hypothetical protein